MPVAHHLSIPLSAIPGGPRASLNTARAAGARAVTPDATAPGWRPRDLDRSARRGLAATLRRLELRLAGLDLFIPPSHLADPARVDRAAEAVRAATGLLAELAALTPTDTALSLERPEGDPSDLSGSLAAGAQNLGVSLVDFGPSPEPWARGLDLARVLAAGDDPVQSIAAGPAPAVIRLADRSTTGPCALGQGMLDAGHVYATIATVAPEAVTVLGLDGLPDPAAAAAAGLGHWARLGVN